MPNGAPPYPDFSQPSVMNPRYGPWIAKILGPIIREHQRQQQFAKYFATDPQGAIVPMPGEAQRALKLALAFGGADITKEQRAQWEAENAQYRKSNPRWMTGGGPGIVPPGQPIEPGTRVQYRPAGARTDPKNLFAGTEIPHTEGVVVDPQNPGTWLGGKPIKPGGVAAEGGLGGGLVTGQARQPGPDYVAVHSPGSEWWWWRHRNDLEVMPPLEEFPVGSKVGYESQTGAIKYDGTVTEPPRGTAPAGPDYVWVDVASRDVPQQARGMKAYAGRESFGAWFHRRDLTKKGGK